MTRARSATAGCKWSWRRCSERNFACVSRNQTGNNVHWPDISGTMRAWKPSPSSSSRKRWRAHSNITGRKNSKTSIDRTRLWRPRTSPRPKKDSKLSLNRLKESLKRSIETWEKYSKKLRARAKTRWLPPGNTTKRKSRNCIKKMLKFPEIMISSLRTTLSSHSPILIFGSVLWLIQRITRVQTLRKSI